MKPKLPSSLPQCMYSFFRGRNEAVTAKLGQVRSLHLPTRPAPSSLQGPSEGSGLEDGSLQLQISSPPDQTPGRTGHGQSWGSSSLPGAPVPSPPPARSLIKEWELSPDSGRSHRHLSLFLGSLHQQVSEQAKVE